MPFLKQVTFVLPHDTLIRYARRGPRRGDRIRGLDGTVYMVLETVPNGVGDVATCVTPLEYARASRSEGERLRRRARAERARAARLRAAAIRAMRVAEARRRSPSGTG